MGRVEKNLLAGGFEDAMSDDLAEAIREAGISIVNLEAPLTERLNPIEKTGPNFIASPRIAEAFKNGGVDVAAMANNHILDQDADGLTDTIEALDSAGLEHFGAAVSAPLASAPVYLTRGGADVALFNLAEGEFARSYGGAGAAPLDVHGTCVSIQNEVAEGRVVILTIHAGNEYQPFPSPFLQNVYRRFIDSGAALVVAHHPHIPQGIELYRRGAIVYSLGNFLFDYKGHVGKACTKLGFLVRADFSGRTLRGLKILPYRSNTDAIATGLSGADFDRFIEYLRFVSEPLHVDRNDLSDADSAARREPIGSLEALWNQEARRLFRDSNASMLGRIFGKYTASAQESNNASGCDPEDARILFNLFRCEAHAEAMKTALKLMHERDFETDGKSDSTINNTLQMLEELFKNPEEKK